MHRSARLPSLPLKGGCQCGAVRYRIGAAPQTFYCCHCRECQRQSASAFGQSVWVAREAFACEGTLACTTRRADSGAVREGWFCPACGVRIFHAGPASPEVVVRGGTLDDTRWLVPAGHIWTASRQPWLSIPSDEWSHPGEPDDFTPLIERWKEMLQRGAVAKM